MKKIIIAGFAVFAATVATGLIYADEGIVEPQIVEPQVVQPQIVEPQIIEEITEEPPIEAVPCPAPEPVKPPVCETCNPVQHTVIITTYHQPVWVEPYFDHSFASYHPFGVAHFGGFHCLPVCW
ncbi:MAG: hypothetical protein P1V20_06390 [Verrucomicrobiales bacterium]|nr:hypothetical protein [Verrucomicrobiales bacterium]